MDAAQEQLLESTRQELGQLAKNARDQLKPWLDERPPQGACENISPSNKWRTQLNKLGGAEGVSTLFKLAQIDADGNGEISDEEVKKYLEDGQDAINRMLELCLNSGIVSALILSFVTPALLTTVEQSDESCGGYSHDGTPIAGHFSPSLCNAFSLAYLVMMQLTFFACSAAMFYSCRIYTVLTVWCITLEGDAPDGEDGVDATTVEHGGAAREERELHHHEVRQAEGVAEAWRKVAGDWRPIVRIAAARLVGLLDGREQRRRHERKDQSADDAAVEAELQHAVDGVLPVLQVLLDFLVADLAVAVGVDLRELEEGGDALRAAELVELRAPLVARRDVLAGALRRPLVEPRLQLVTRVLRELAELLPRRLEKLFLRGVHLDLFRLKSALDVAWVEL